MSFPIKHGAASAENPFDKRKREQRASAEKAVYGDRGGPSDSQSSAPNSAAPPAAAGTQGPPAGGLPDDQLHGGSPQDTAVTCPECGCTFTLDESGSQDPNQPPSPDQSQAPPMASHQPPPNGLQ